MVEAAFQFAADVAHAVADAVGDAMLAAVLHGSLVTASFVPGRSDIDLLVIVSRPLGSEDVGALTDVAERLSGVACPAVDLRVVSKSATERPSASPRLEFGVRISQEGLADLYGQGSPEPDLLVEFATARAAGRSLIGPPPEAVIGPVPAPWIDAYGLALVKRWQALFDDDAHAEFMVLTACRVWRFAVERILCSKERLLTGRWSTLRPSPRSRRHSDDVPAFPELSLTLSRSQMC